MNIQQALISQGVKTQAAARFASSLAAIMPLFNIDNRARASAFLGQCHVESAGFSRLSENLTYTSPARLVAVWPSRFRDTAAAALYVRQPERLANRVYAGRLGNGPEEGGDGWRFRGRGLKQLTGRDNYRAAAEALGRPYLQQPDLVAMPDDAVRTACWFWRANGCNALADLGDHAGITRRVNGPAMLQATQRRTVVQRIAAML